MTLSSSMTSLMDKARKLSGLNSKMSIDDLTKLMDHFDLHINPNLLGNAGITLTGDNVILSNWDGVIEEDNEKVYVAHNYQWNQIAFRITINPGTYTYSADLTGPIGDDPRFFVQGSNGVPGYVNYSITLANDGEWHRCKQTFSIKEKNTYQIFFTNVNKQKNIKLESGSLMTPLPEVGGSAVP